MSEPKADIDVLIVAAGSSTRMKGDMPKVYRPLRGKAVLRHSVETFLNHPKIRHVLVLINPDHRSYYDEAILGLDMPEPVAGGATRQESVQHGLQSLRAQAPAYVMIHDAARPGADAALIDRVADALKISQAVIPVLPVKDTIKLCAGNLVQSTLPRESLCAVQTPQGFAYSLIATAHACIDDALATDDASLVEAMGIEVMTVQGSEQNHKLTTIEDYHAMQQMRSYVGQGFDVHRLIESDKPLMLCGIEIESPLSLEGHSDADVGLHALVDAMLGSIAAGDIGQHFPPSDAQWKGAASDQFVKHALSLLREKSAEIYHVDLTIICEAPKIGAHRSAMQQRVAELLEIAPQQVSIKATTTEKLGFTGRGEGIAAQAVVNVQKAV